MSFAKAFPACGELRAAALLKTQSRTYLLIIGERKTNMTRLITLLTTVSIIAIALSPAAYTYASLA
ncbi:MAG: hypothetical protein DHS20C05_13580 [Hyphococcus sp.]|nr:MAG: hypothetical protein DHS20C05_13580 [Marinicaulis sp.]